MGHHIDFSKKEKGAYVGLKPAWHKLGTVFEDQISVEEAIQFGGLDFTVHKSPNEHIIRPVDEDPIRVVSEDSFFLWRDDTQKILANHVGKVYETLQNGDAFEVVNDLLTAGMKIDTAGVLREGQITWVSLTKGSMSIKGDQVETQSKSSTPRYA